MKSSVKLGVILIGLIIFGNAEVWGADWKLYTSNSFYWGYYDTQSITRPSKNIVRVWSRRDFTEKGVLDMGSLGEEYKHLSQARGLSEIDCVEKTIRYLSITYYDNKEGVIHSFSSPSEWDFIIPESTGESAGTPVPESFYSSLPKI